MTAFSLTPVFPDTLSVCVCARACAHVKCVFFYVLSAILQTGPNDLPSLFESCDFHQFQ